MHQHDLRRGINDPILLDARSLIQIEFYQPVRTAGGIGKYFNDKVRRAVDAMPVHLVRVANDHNVRLYDGIYISRRFARFFKETYIKRGRIYFAAFPGEVVGKLTEQLAAYKLMNI